MEDLKEPTEQDLADRVYFGRISSLEVLHAFGISEEHIRSLDPSHQKMIFTGIRNLDMTNQVLSWLDPDEIAAKLFGVTRFKKLGRQYHKDIPRDFIGLAKYLDNLAYPELAREGIRKWPKRYSAERGDQERRLGNVGLVSRRKFIASAFGIFAPPERRIRAYAGRVHDYFRQRAEEIELEQLLSE